MALEAGKPAPYAPPGAVKDVITRFRDRGLQTPFTREVLERAGVTESLTPRTLQALKILDLIDEDGNPAQVLRDYARAPGGEAREIMERQIRQAYEPVFLFVNPAADDMDQVRDAFRGYEPRGQQERMVTLFMGLCEFAGIVSEPPRRAAASQKPVRNRLAHKAAEPKSRPAVGHTGQNGGENQQTAAIPGGLPPAVEGMVRQLASKGPSWTREGRDRFMTAWAAIIEYSFPVQDSSEGFDDS